MQFHKAVTGAVLVTAPPQADIEYHQERKRQLRRWTSGYAVLLGCCSILAAAAAASQFAARDPWVGALLVVLCGQLGFICAHLAMGVYDTQGVLHIAGSQECFAQVRQRYTDSHRHLALTFAPQGPLTVEGVRREDAAEYMLLMSESADVEKHLAALKERMAVLREAESDMQEAEAHDAGCACVGCDELD